jgi:hypothetical protein
VPATVSVTLRTETRRTERLSRHRPDSGDGAAAVSPGEFCYDAGVFSTRAILVAIFLMLVGASSASAATGPDAVVVVSGFTTTTPFTTPAAQCHGSKPHGPTWSYIGAKLAAAGYKVYTAPVNYGLGPVKPDPPQFSSCPRQLPASMTINSRGHTFLNAIALASYLNYLHSRYGVSTVRIVGHSFGGLWSRGALRLPFLFPGIRVLSLTTLGTPHLGSFLADIAEGVDPNLCGNSFACQVVVYALIAARELYFEPALSELTQAALGQWNPGQRTSLNGIPVSAIAGDAVSFPGQPNRYVSPNDVAVGIASAQAVGLQSQGVIPTLGCFAPFPDVHSDTELPLVPTAKHSLTNDPGVVADVKQTLAGNPPTTRCPNPAGGRAGLERLIALDPVHHSLTVPLQVAVQPAQSLLPRPLLGDAIFVKRGTRITCHGRSLTSIPFFDRAGLRVIEHPVCGTRLRVAPSGAGALYLRNASERAVVTVHGKRISVGLRRAAHTCKLDVALRRGHSFVHAKLDRHDSLLGGRHDRVEELRVTVSRCEPTAAEAAVTVQLG